jgi:4-hydroxy 2-oxovalerate aldolase
MQQKLDRVESRYATLLDCTLRDGGYYNNWDFSLSEVQEYIYDLARGGVPIIEIGFRFTPKNRFLGPFAYTSEDLLSQLDLPEAVTFGVMINAADYLTETWENDLRATFVPASDSTISLVRIAAHILEVAKCEKLVAWLKAAGYDVGLNIMQISQADEAGITAMVENIEANFVPFEALYFADSLGNLSTDDVTKIVALFRAASSFAIGFHGHDNIGRGVTNSMAALEAGAQWVDATVTGMGRGAGNTQTEFLALEMARKGFGSYNQLDIQRAATGWLADLKSRCCWGTNIFYYEAGLRSLHPSYVQQMIALGQFAPVDILVMIAALSGGETPTSYNEANIDQAMAAIMNAPTGSDTVDGLWSGRPVLLVANGTQAVRHWPAVAAYAMRHNAVILAVNHLTDIDASVVDGVICLHPARMMALLHDASWCNLTVYSARGALPASLRADFDKRASVVDYGVQVVADAPLIARPDGCQIPVPEVLAYAWALAEQGEASALFLAGFDGFDGQSPVFRKTDELIASLRAQSSLDVCTLTASNYDLPHANIYTR